MKTSEELQKQLAKAKRRIASLRKELAETDQEVRDGIARNAAVINERDHLLEALRVISHAPEYDGSLCHDKDDCPNCWAQKVIRNLEERRCLR